MKNINSNESGHINLALNKPTAQSSVYRPEKYSYNPHGACNGKKNGGFSFHTLKQDSPWWQIDLQGIYQLSEIRVYNRINFEERARTLNILLSYDALNWNLLYSNNTNNIFGGINENPLTVNVNLQAARYVRLQLRENESLHLDEVEIYGIPRKLDVSEPKYDIDEATLYANFYGQASWKPSPHTVQNAIMSMLSKLRMHDTELGKVRVGNMGDGGYVIPDDLAGIKGVVSIGIGREVSFDKHFADIGVKVFQYDHTVQSPPIIHENFLFNKIGWGSQDSNGFITLSTILENNGLDEGDLILKFDVENAEWDALLDVQPDLLKRFRIITCELHYFNKLEDISVFSKVNRVISLLTANHKVVHIHPNNCCGVALVAGVTLPKLIEFSFLRNDRASFYTSHESIPSSLDYPNVQSKPQIILTPFHADIKKKLSFQDDCHLLNLQQSPNLQYIKAARKLQREKKLDQAITTYQIAIERNPNFSWYYQGLGDAFVKVGNLEQATTSYGKAIKLNPNLAYCYYSLGILLFHKGNYEEAAALCRRALEIQPNCALYSKIFGSVKTVQIDNRNQLFTVQLNKGSGLGAQLVQWEFLYLLGRLLGYQYVYQDLICQRSSSNTYNFLGVDEYNNLPPDTDLSQIPVIDCNITDNIYSNKTEDLEPIKNHIKELLDSSDTEKTQKIVRFNAGSWPQHQKIKNFVYKLSKDTKCRNLFKTELNLPFMYWKAREKMPVSIPFRHNKIKVVLHIRKGDTAVVKINDDLYSCWQYKIESNGACKISVERIPDTHKSLAKHFKTSDYYNVLKKLFLELGEHNFSVIVISDGYDRSFQRIRNAANDLDLKLDDIERAETFYKKEYDVFCTHSNVNCVIGEKEDQFYKSVHALACCDAVIYGQGTFVTSIVEYLRFSNDNPIMFSMANKENVNSLVAKLKSKFGSHFLV